MNGAVEVDEANNDHDNEETSLCYSPSSAPYFDYNNVIDKCLYVPS